MRHRISMCVVALVLAASASMASAQSVKIQVDGEMTVGVPATVTVLVEGFGEDEPKVDALDIAGCQVRPLGKFPQRSERLSIVNGRRSHSVDVSWSIQYQVTCDKAGKFRVAPITAGSGGTTTSARGGMVQVGALEATDDMQLRVVVPDGSVWIGQPFDATIEWYVSDDVSEPTFELPLLNNADWVQILPQDIPGRSLAITIGTNQIELPITQSQATYKGRRYTKVELRVQLLPLRAGTLELGTPRVSARMNVGYTRDNFGFRVPRTKLVTALGEPGTLIVEDAPQAGRPADFVNAVGQGFSLDVQARRTVVRVGDPIELEIVVRGDGRMEGLTLPNLTTAGLFPAVFAVPDMVPAGVVSADGKSKTFQVTVRLLSRDTTAIPALSFSWFDPRTKTYSTARSQPIALSVQGGSTVTANDVVSGTKPVEQPNAEGTGTAPLSLVGADLSLSAADVTLKAALSGSSLTVLVGALYVVPLLLFGVVAWRTRTRGDRGARAAANEAQRAVQQALAKATREPARDAAPALALALQRLKRVAPNPGAWDSAVLESLEHAGFDPIGAREPLPQVLRDRAAVLARALGEFSVETSRAVTLVSWIVGLTLLGVGSTGFGSGVTLEEGRRAYARALEEQDRTARVQAFAQAESVFATLAQAHPMAPELLTDWGNAALGAGETGRAVLAYRRALYIDPSAVRAKKNLVWLRERAPEGVPRARVQGATESFLVWRDLSPASRTLGAAFAFGVAVMLVTPWGGRRSRGRAVLAVLPAGVWLLLTSQSVLADPRDDDGVVISADVIVRAADSLGAPPALPQPLPAGTEIDVLERRGTFLRIALADDRRGWVPQATVAFVGDALP